MANDKFEGVERVIAVRSNIGDRCKVCDAPIGFSNNGFTDSINHYITEHDFRLLHIGTETEGGENNSLWQVTVAILGA
ncbi:MAG TPA: hypothetical protein VGJ15_04940 [Pirellulales bacterium]|jgi:hypothetical protein